ncbi:50S ribosomal protein L20 [Staphylococcus aureus]
MRSICFPLDRRQRKRDFRKLWITRINAAARYMQRATTFNERFEKSWYRQCRKMLSEIAISDEKAFAQLVTKAKDALK